MNDVALTTREAQARERIVARLVAVLSRSSAGRDPRLIEAGRDFRALVASQAGCRRRYVPSDITWRLTCERLASMFATGERPCRFDHEHTRRDGRPCSPFECHAEHAAQLADLSDLREEIG